MKNVPLFIVRARPRDREALEAHFLSLDREDRRLRFGAGVSDAALREYVARIDFERDAIFMVQDAAAELLAVLHVACAEDAAEIGLSVLSGWRAMGLGGALLACAVRFLGPARTPKAFVYCLAENGAMMHLARKHGLRVMQAGSLAQRA